MRTLKLAVAAMVLTGFSSAAISAHHSFSSEYDRDKPVTITGTVTKIEWTNPHTHFYLDVKNKTGDVSNWQVEGYPPNALYRSGFRQNVTIKIGDTVTIAGWQGRDGKDWMQGREMTLSSGEKYYVGPGAR